MTDKLTTDKSFRTPEGETWTRIAGHYFLITDKDGKVNVQPRPAPVPGLRELKHTALKKVEHIVQEGLFALMDDAQVAWVYTSDDELYYVTPRGYAYLVRQGSAILLRRCVLPIGTRFTLTSDWAVLAMIDIADDLDDEEK